MTTLPFTNQEYEGRLAKVRQKMVQERMDALIVTGPMNIFYLCGYRAAMMSRLSPLMAVVVPAKGQPRLITRSLEARVANQQWTGKPVLFMDHVDPFKLLVEILGESGSVSGMIGIEEANLTVGRLNRIKQALSKAKFKDASGMIKDLMAHPSKTEVDYLKMAASIANIGFQRGIETVKEGVYCYEVVAEIHHAVFKAGQTDGDVSPVCCWAGPDGGPLHSSALDYMIRKGDLVTIELGGTYHMYKLNAQGTVYVGEHPPEIILKTYKMVSDMYRAASDRVKPGAKAGEVYDGANQIYRAITGEDYFRRVGGSMGLGSFAIDLVKGNQELLHPGVALLVQPLVIEPFLITCSSTILVTETGREELTRPLLQLNTV